MVVLSRLMQIGQRVDMASQPVGIVNRLKRAVCVHRYVAPRRHDLAGLGLRFIPGW